MKQLIFTSIEDSEKIKFNILKVSKNIVSNIDDLFNIIRFIHSYYEPCNSENCNPRPNLIHNYRMRILSIFMYPKSRQTIIGKKFTSRDGLADRYQEITRAFEENIHRTRVSMIDNISKLDFLIGYYEQGKLLPFWEIFSKNFDKLVSVYQMSRLFSFDTVSRYLQTISDRDRTSALNNLISSFNLLHQNTYPGKAILSIKNINKYLNTRYNLFSKKKTLNKTNDEIFESLQELEGLTPDDLSEFIQNIKERIYDHSQQQSIVSMIFFITIFIHYCKEALKESYSDQTKINKFEDDISILVDNEGLIDDLILVLFNDNEDKYYGKTTPDEYDSEEQPTNDSDALIVG